MEPQDVATALVRTRFPDPVAAFLTGSVAAGSATSTSDLDIVVVVEDEAAEWRETTRVEGWLVELFVHTEVSLREWYAREATRHLCTLAHMVATGIAITGATEADALIRKLEPTSNTDLLHVPGSSSMLSDIDLTAAVDDLLGCSDGGERVFIAGQVTEMIGQLTLANRDAWSGSGKWLYRWLESIDLDLARRLADGCRAAVSSVDMTPLDQIATEVLAVAGGRLQEGYRLS